MSAMKMLVFLLSVLAGVWLWRRGRRPARTGQHVAPRGAPGTPVLMVRCTHCGTHVPAHDALEGRKGMPYCSAAHRDAGEGAA